ncbi:MAG: helix-turn-helix transcriptional regulator [Gammaproteobacteria bacterium]|nr:helix-turn-helix transcriptional regulator [Gammaproteobacteria bacterium]
MAESPERRAFGIVLRELRQKAGYSQEALALECDLDRTFISMLERGVRGASLDTVFSIARALDTTPSKLVSMVEKIAPPR